jgi:hypothetical protein
MAGGGRLGRLSGTAESLPGGTTAHRWATEGAGGKAGSLGRVAERVCLRSPVRGNRAPGSVRGR